MITATRVVCSVPPERLICCWIILHDFWSTVRHHIIPQPRSGRDELCRMPPLPILCSSSPTLPHLLPHLPARHTHYSPGKARGSRRPWAEAGGGRGRRLRRWRTGGGSGRRDGRRNGGGRAHPRLLLVFDLCRQQMLRGGEGTRRGGAARAGLSPRLVGAGGAATGLRLASIWWRGGWFHLQQTAAMSGRARVLLVTSVGSTRRRAQRWLPGFVQWPSVLSRYASFPPSFYVIFLKNKT